MKRKQFTFYRSFWETIENLQTNKEKLQAYQMLCDYALNQTEPDLKTKKPTAAVVFQISRPILDRALSRAKSAMTEITLAERVADALHRKEQQE